MILRPDLEPIIYSKQHLYEIEQHIFTASTQDRVIDFDKEKIAVAICYDLSKIDHAKIAKQNQASVYIASVLNSFNGIESDLAKLSNIAKDNQMLTLMANFIGKSGGYDCAGQSAIWNTQGELIAQLDAKHQGLLAIDTFTQQTENIII